MNWTKSATLILLGLAGTTASGQGLPAAGFVIRLPHDVKPETVIIVSGLYGHGLAMSDVQTKKGVFDYAVEVDRGSDGIVDRLQHADSLKLLIYCPGYQMVTATFTQPGLQARRTFVPPLEKLPTIPLEVRLVNSTHQPVSGQTLYLSYNLIEAMPYFGYSDGMVPTLRIAIGKTNAEGAVALDVPSFAEDPFFQAYNAKPYAKDQFLISGQSNPRDNTLRPASFSTQKSYTQPLIITKTLLGTLSGQLGEAFLQRHGLPGNLTLYLTAEGSAPSSIRLDANAVDDHVSYNANLKSDRMFDVDLPPGRYDLTLFVLRPGETQEKIVVQSGVVVEESKRTVITPTP